MVVEVTGLLRSTNLPVLWYFSSPTTSLVVPSLNNVLKSFIFQALRHDPTIVSQDPRLGSIQAFQAQHNLAEWTSLAILVLSKIKQCFVVVETEDLYRLAGHDGAPVQQIIDTFSRIFEEVVQAGGVMKLLLVSYGSRANLAIWPAQTSPIVVALNASLPVVRRAKQPLTAQLRIGSGRNRLQPRLTAR
jgi:hypothetical protein